MIIKTEKTSNFIEHLLCAGHCSSSLYQLIGEQQAHQQKITIVGHKLHLCDRIGKFCLISPKLEE